MAARAWLCGVLAPALFLSGCAGNRAAFVDALIMGTLAAGAAAERRAEGDCWTPCGFGTACNPETGYCEPLPCRGQCGPEELCVQTESEERCEPAPAPDLSVGRKQGEAPPPPFGDAPAPL